MREERESHVILNILLIILYRECVDFSSNKVSNKNENQIITGCSVNVITIFDVDSRSQSDHSFFFDSGV